jgi:hypothetical protein
VLANLPPNINKFSKQINKTIKQNIIRTFFGSFEAMQPHWAVVVISAKKEHGGPCLAGRVL